MSFERLFFTTKPFYFFPDWSTTLCSTSRPSSRVTPSRRSTRKSSWPSRRTQNQPSGFRRTKCFKLLKQKYFLGDARVTNNVEFKLETLYTPLASFDFWLSNVINSSVAYIGTESEGKRLLKINLLFFLRCKYLRKVLLW